MDDKHNKIQAAQRSRIMQLITIGIPSLLLLWVFSVVMGERDVAASRGANISTTSTLDGPRQKILYVVTTLSEYDTGSRSTQKGNDRLQNTLIPVVVEGIESMLLAGFDVDLYIICHYPMTRRQMLQDALPSTVGLEIWDVATPIGYKLEDKDANHTQDITRALARQHRFVIKDKFDYYDFFVNFEDDMLITGASVQNYIEVSRELARLRELAPEKSPNTQFYGPLTKAQLQRMIPGFIRVEVLLDEDEYGVQTALDPVPVTDRPLVDPAPCCHLQNMYTVSSSRPRAPQSDELMLWETNIRALGVHKMPLQSTLLDWVVFLRGPRIREERWLQINDFWSGTNGYFRNATEEDKKRRPDTKDFKYINNQGGWMASRDQIWEWHTKICPGGFLPPYESPEYNRDGLDMRNVEYWSGGLSMFTREHGCNLQRVISLDPTRFAKSLLYHTANNKQRQLQGRRKDLVKVNDFLGELYTVRADAQAEMHRRVLAMNEAHHV
eukprot:Nitzschia sp. Nitz4//scaffold399_size11037//4959//6446//NITZ4_009052-RA/size11037-processed-gene-0.1-mRNA-1//1//CDS//3329550325//7662//frame0